MIKTKEELIQRIDLGETYEVQFKSEISSFDSLEAEMVAFANAEGGYLLIGVDDDKNIIGLDDKTLQKYVQEAGNISSDKINPPIQSLVNTIAVEDKKVLVIYIPQGVVRPYFTKQGVCWIKTGADKRKVSRDELRRLFQHSHDYYPDEQIIQGTGIDDIDLTYFSRYYFKVRSEAMADSGYDIPTLLHRMNVLEDHQLTLAGLLYFGKEPQQFREIFHIKAVSFVGNDIEGNNYRDSVDIHGTMEVQFRNAIDFCKRNLRFIQKGKSFNSIGDLEISEIALEEAIINAIFHRDYTKSSPIRLLIFENRLEIISPGSLPNHLTEENILYGDTVIRNHRMVSFGSKILPYRGLGSGIRRILAEHPNTTFENNKEIQQFKVTFKRIPV